MQRYFEQALERAGQGGDAEARGLAFQGLGQIKFFAQEFPSAVEMSVQAESILSQVGTPFHRVNACGIAIMSAAYLGDLQTAESMGQLLRKNMEGNLDPGWWTFWNFYFSGKNFLLGRWEDGLHYAELGIETGEKSGRRDHGFCLGQNVAGGPEPVDNEGVRKFGAKLAAGVAAFRPGTQRVL